MMSGAAAVALLPSRAGGGVKWPHEPAVYGSGHILPPWVKRMLEVAQVGGRYRLEDLVHFEGSHGRIQARITQPADLAELANTAAVRNGVVRFTVEGDPGIWTLQVIPRRASRGDDETILTCYDAGSRGTFACFSLAVGNGVTSFKACDFAAPGGRGRYNICFVDTGDSLRATWQLPPLGVSRSSGTSAPDAADDVSKTKDRPANFVEFQTKHPLVWERQGLPVLRRLGAGHLMHRHPAIEVYRTFDSIMPDSKAAGQVSRLMDALGSSEFADRQAAELSLRQMGRAAILPLLRVDRAALSPEQSDRWRRLLAADDWRPFAGEVGAARIDLPFLLDCLDDEDPAVRGAAKHAAETLIGRPLDLDPSLDPHARCAAVDSLCDQLRDSAAFRAAITRPAAAR